MKEEDEKSYLNADSAILKIGSRPALLIISSIDDKTFIHTDSNSLNVYTINDNNKDDNTEQIAAIDLSICNVNHITKKLNIEELKRMIKVAVVSDLHTNQLNDDSHMAYFEQNILKTEESFSEDSDNEALFKRVKGQKLTGDQIKYLKDCPQKSELTTKEICYKF